MLGCAVSTKRGREKICAGSQAASMRHVMNFRSIDLKQKPKYHAIQTGTPSTTAAPRSFRKETAPPVPASGLRTSLARRHGVHGIHRKRCLQTKQVWQLKLHRLAGWRRRGRRRHREQIQVGQSSIQRIHSDALHTWRAAASGVAGRAARQGVLVMGTPKMCAQLSVTAAD
jgi:hypothetical protein